MLLPQEQYILEFFSVFEVFVWKKNQQSSESTKMDWDLNFPCL